MSHTRSVLRWMCRPLVEPAFLRLLLTWRDGEPLPYTAAYAFDRLEADTEHPGYARDAARERLSVALKVDRPALVFARTLAALRAWGNESERADVCGYAALPELVGGPTLAPLTDYHEIHAHLRGSVPWPCLWVGWLADERWRGRQRGRSVRTDGWSKTHAELIEIAARCRDGLDVDDRSDLTPDLSPEAESSWWVRLADRVSAEGADSAAGELLDEALDNAATYLAILATLRRENLFRRGSAQGEVGLKPFVESYDRYSKAQKRGRSEAGERRAQIAMILDRFQRDGAVAVELRPTFEARPGDMRRRLLDLVEGYLVWLARSPQNNVALGLVPSLFKQQPVGSSKARDALGEMEDAEARAALWEAQVQALTEILEDEPILRWFVVGLDAAGAERGCPPRLLARAYAALDAYHRRHGVAAHRPGVRLPMVELRSRARRFEAEGVDVLRDLWPGWPRLGRTVHAGEDFVDPLTGLRHIDEALAHLGFGAGDRVGHAIAAALGPEDVKELLRRRSRAPERTGVRSLGADRWLLRVPRGEHLLDLAWAAETLAEGGDLARSHLREAATRTWLGALPVLLQGLAASNPRPALSGLHYGPRQIPDAQIVEEVEIDAVALELREILRKRVLAELVRRRVTVESCPRSNLAVADLDRAPIFGLAKEDGLRVALATDDPALFESFPAIEVARVKALTRAKDGDVLTRVVEEGQIASWVGRLTH